MLEISFALHLETERLNRLSDLLFILGQSLSSLRVIFKGQKLHRSLDEGQERFAPRRSRKSSSARFRSVVCLTSSDMYMYINTRRKKKKNEQRSIYLLDEVERGLFRWICSMTFHNFKDLPIFSVDMRNTCSRFSSYS